MKALIDGDIIVYQAGFASDKKLYHCHDGFTCQYMKDAIAHCVSIGIDKSTIFSTVTAEPVAHCLNSVKKMIMGIKEKIDADEVLVFLTGKGNFREKIYTEYKANRDPTAKPIHYKEIREYLLDVWKADEVIGVEADDAMGWHQYKDLLITKSDQLSGESCICTVDKDLNQIPGWHYNWRLDGGEGFMYWIDPQEANQFFFEQWLMGDSADNIPGLHGVGQKTVNKWIGDFVAEGEPTSLEFYEYVKSKYVVNKCKVPCDAKMFHIIGDLLWMQRNPGETWDMYLGLTKERNAYEQAQAKVQ